MSDYIIKFVSQLEHADTLLGGRLFMRPAMYYHELEKGRGDDTEGAIDNSADNKLYKCWSHPVYCVYYLDEKNIADGKAIIDHKVITDFECKDGYAVLIPAEKFMSLIPQEYDGSKVYMGMVKYGESTPLSTLCSIIDSTGKESLFLKPLVFSHQKEFRITINKQLFDRPDRQKARDTIFYCDLDGNFRDVARIIPVKNHLIESGDMLIENL